MRLALVYAVKQQRRVRTIPVWPFIGMVSLIILLGAIFIGYGIYKYQQLVVNNQQLLAQLNRPEAGPFTNSVVQAQQSSLQWQVGMMAEQLAEQHQLLSQLSHKIGVTLTPTASPVLNLDVTHLGTAQSWLQLLQKQFQITQNQTAMVELTAERRHLKDISYISGWPAWEKGVWLSSPYGRRRDPFTGRYRYHEGVDIAGTEGVQIHSVAAGVVSWAGKRFGFGNMVEIEHGNGMVTRYAHTQKVLVQVGDVVTKGEIIALMGSTGRSTGPHVHFEVLHNGQHLNPVSYMERRIKKS
ncbi:M23 family metallopeptidase [Celerinatantimonas sp. YJH-8]|uniref:M23 family metallopeptidase n=1 Tax=Celerinatantimonas sp. YJH-8 TaxID=3228714 RepID=UPI0038C5C642